MRACKVLRELVLQIGVQMGAPALLPICIGCAWAPTEEVTLNATPVIYGADDRVELDSSTLPAARMIEEALVALIPQTRLREATAGGWAIQAERLGAAQGLCPAERFADQPSAATCSGTLAANGLVLTARHCVTSLEHCHSLSWVFGYAYRGAGELGPLTRDDVYECRSIVEAAYDSARSIDYAWVELDREVRGRRPLQAQRQTEPIVLGSCLLAAGFGQGLPAKLDPDVRVLASFDTYFTASFDSFIGSSGMPVLSQEGTWLGFALRGEADYEAVGGCRRAKTLGVNCEGCSFGGERVAYLTAALSGLELKHATHPQSPSGLYVGAMRSPDLAPEVTDGGVAEADPRSDPRSTREEPTARPATVSGDRTPSCSLVEPQGPRSPNLAVWLGCVGLVLLGAVRALSSRLDR